MVLVGGACAAHQGRACATLPPAHAPAEPARQRRLPSRVPRVRIRGLVLAVLLLVLLPASASAAAPTAVITRTEHGIPHIRASSYLGAGYGYGYAFAQDDICTMAEDYVTVDAQRSLYFGPNGSYEQRGNGISPNNLNSDFFWQQVIDSHVVDGLLARPAPNGPEQPVRDLVRGYVAGYNRYLASVGGSAGVPDPTCRGKPWVKPISEATAYRRFYQLVLLASSDVGIDGIGEAQPPAGAGLLSGLGAGTGVDAVRLGHALSGALDGGAIGSNAVAIGKGGSRDHTHGLLLGNPHFPWIGTERFYQAQITIPGKLDVEGASLFGVPLILIGHTKNMAWSHTVSTARRFTLYQMTLVPGEPTTYLYDGKPEAMSSHALTVQGPGGQVFKRTLWSTRYGPMLDSIVGVPLPWQATTGFSLADVNATNFRVFNHFFDTDNAQSAPQELSILNRYQGIPWVNTIVADRAGNALYADIGAVPNVPDAMVQRCSTPVGQVTFQEGRLPTLDGSTSSCQWQNDPDSAVPGIIGRSHMPHLYRSDYVTNSNDSYWLSNPHQPLTGFAQIIGDEGTARTLRTRIGLIMTQARVSGTDGLGPAGFTRQQLQDMDLSDRQYGGELVRDAAVSMCRGFPGGLAPSSSGPPVAVGNACDVLAAWDLHENLGSKGDILFRLFWEGALASEAGPWANPFNAGDPVNTPNGLNTSNPQVQTAFGDAINEMNGAHIPLDAAPGDVQHQNGIPIHGGPGDPDGEFNAIYLDFTPGQGYAAPYTGSSYIQAVAFDTGACPDARTILTYSESADPHSPYFSDQTQLFSRKQWVTERFCASDVAKHAVSVTRLGASKKKARHRRRRPHSAPAARFTG